MPVEEVYTHPDDYDLELAARGVDDVPFWLDVLRREEPRRVLEIGAGTGRLTIPLAREGARCGFTVVGLEPERAMLERARRAAEREPREVRAALRLVYGDATHLNLDERFDVVLMPYGVAHHLLDLHAQTAAWRAVRGRLAPGGLFCVDVLAPDLAMLARAVDGIPRQEDMDATGPDGRHLRRSVATRYAPATQVATLEYEYDIADPDGTRRHYPSAFAMHVYYPRELELLFLLTGFHLERIVGSYAGERADDRSRLMIAFGRGVSSEQ